MAAQQASMPGGFGPGDRPLEDIPNYDRLTRSERAIMGMLPGIANSKAGQFLAGLNEGWLGKVFVAIDQPREFAERTIGLATQAIHASRSPEEWEDFRSNLAAAWYAGTFTADFANMPNWSDGQLKIPVDLPGVTGLVAARQQLARMAESGVEMRDAVPQIRQWVYDSAGALAIRMQWQDLTVGLAIDPLNWVLPYLAPVERAKAATIAARAARRAGYAQDALAAVENTAEAMRAAGRVEDATRLVDEARTAIEAIKEITPVQEFVLRISAASNPDSFWGRLLSSRLNPFALTPESRARELAINLNDNLLSIIGRTDIDPEEAVRMIVAASDGTFDPRIAHLLVTEEGRMTRSLLQGVSGGAQDLVSAWRITRNERNFVGFMARTLGDEPEKLLSRIFRADEGQAVLAQFIEKAQPEELARMAAALGLDPSALTLEAIVGKLDPLYRSGLLTQEAFKTNLLVGIAEISAKAMVTKYGLKESGFLVKLGQAMKSAESLAFLRMNPGYLVRNILNNEATVIARLGLSWSKKAADDFLKGLGFSPTRLRQGFGMAGIEAKMASGDARAIATANKFNEVFGEATRGQRGWLEKFREFFSEANLGKLDMAQASNHFEASASQKAYIAGMMRFRRKYMQVTKMGDDVRDTLRAAVGDDGVRTIEGAMRDAFNDADVDRILMSQNAHLSPQAVLDNAAQRFGTDLNDVIQVEELDGMVSRVAEAFQEGGSEGARDAAAGIRVEMQQRLSAELAEEIQDITEDVAVRVRVGGPDEALRQSTEGIDVFWGEAHAQYAQEFGVLYDSIRNAPIEARPGLWASSRAKAREFFDEKWAQLEARAKGVEEGIARVERETGQRFPFKGEYKQTFGEWRSTWKKFYGYRDKLIDSWVAGKADYEDVVGKINAAYENAIQAEERAWFHMDEVLAQMVPPEVRDVYMAGRNGVAEWRKAMRDVVVQFQENPLGDGRRYIDLADVEKQQAYRQFWQTRTELLGRIKESEDQLKAAMLGSREAASDLARRVPPAEVQTPQLIEAFESASAEVTELAGVGAENAGKVQGHIAGFSRRVREAKPGSLVVGWGDPTISQAAEIAAKKLGMTPDEFQARFFSEVPGFITTETAPPVGEFVWNALPDVDGVLKRPMPKIAGEHELWYSRGSKALDSVVEATVEQGSKKALRFDGLTDEGQRAVRQYGVAAKSNLASQRYQMIKFGEWTRDSALLNYNRRLNYNTWLGILMPYEFWTTTSIRKWALHSIDRPFVATAYWRMQNFLDRGFRPEYGLPARLRHRIRIKMPFLPDWMGNELFIDPLGGALPFANWRRSIEMLTSEASGDQYRAQTVLNEMRQDEMITEQEYQDALQRHAGPAWERAIGLARTDDTEGRANAMDVLSVLSNPHAPVVWAYNALSGHPEKIGPFTPIERSIKGLTALLGIGPAGGLNPLGAARQHFGLPAFDQWDDYRTDRMLANMAADGAITVDAARRAMIEREGPAFEEAKRRAGIEFGVGAMGSLTGIPAGAYPPGEEHLRKLKDDYQAAWAAHEGGDLDAMQRFYDENPAYEARRMALWDKPEERLQRFVTDEIWARWRELPVQHKREVADQLGELFQSALLDKETRSIENIPLDTLQAWLKIMGGDPPGMVHWDQDTHPLQGLTDPDIAQRLEAFYRTRESTYRYNDDVAPLQDDYFKLDKRGRQQFLRDHPALKQYWDWRRDFMIRNPTLAPYIEDDPEKLPKYKSEQELREVEAAEPSFTWREWYNVLGASAWRLANDTMALDLPLNKATVDELEAIAASLGMDVDRLLSDMNRAYQESQ